MKRRKPRKKAIRLTDEKKLEIAQFIVEHQKLTVKQVASAFGIRYMPVWRIIQEYVDIRKVYVLKASEKPTEQGSDKELPT